MGAVFVPQRFEHSQSKTREFLALVKEFPKLRARDEAGGGGPGHLGRGPGAQPVDDSFGDLDARI